MRIILVTYLCVLLSFCSFSQSQESISEKCWQVYLEALGNGGHYSVNGELSKTKEKVQGGDRFGISYFTAQQPGSTANTRYVAFIYEKNFTIGNKLVRPEFGVGGTLFFLHHKTLWYYYSHDTKNYQLNGNKIVCWMVPRVGFRLVSKTFWFLRFGYTPAIFLTELNEKNTTKFDSRFGAGFGVNLNHF